MTAVCVTLSKHFSLHLNNHWSRLQVSTSWGSWHFSGTLEGSNIISTGRRRGENYFRAERRPLAKARTKKKKANWDTSEWNLICIRIAWRVCWNSRICPQSFWFSPLEVKWENLEFCYIPTLGWCWWSGDYMLRITGMCSVCDGGR